MKIKIILASVLLSCMTSQVSIADTSKIEQPEQMPVQISIKKHYKKKCIDLIQQVEAELGLPNNLLHAVGVVESQLHPYAVHARGKAYYFEDKAKAVHFIENLRKQGLKNFDVGCMQINYLAHGKNFASLEDMLDPHTNIMYAGKLLKAFKARFKNWEKAVKYYHTANPTYNTGYHARVYKVYKKMQPQGGPSVLSSKQNYS
ncbi:MAG: transglycosylase SLT domain-containing protein [Alphaproteobacteria bacterium]|nr:transglycosylase SLT domain-containing protein [Alphaproteobacteria bacterium]